MAGVGLQDGKAKQALESVKNTLPQNTALSYSSRRSRNITFNLGEISSYPPGYKENGGVFCHTNPWIMIAETMARQRRPGF